MNITITTYRDTFWEALCIIHDAARKQELALARLDKAFLPLTVAAKREGLLEYPHLDVALENGIPVGFSAYDAEELCWLYVSPEKMRRGIGRSLVQHALKTEPALHYIEVLAGNEPAKALYESMGFQLKEILSGKMPGNENFAVQVYSMYRK